MGRGASDQILYGDGAVSSDLIADRRRREEEWASAPTEIDEDGTRRWRNDSGQLHREGGPAVEHPDGSRFWWRNGKLHREDGPAVEIPGDRQEWCQNGKLHREDRPAVVFANGPRNGFSMGA